MVEMFCLKCRDKVTVDENKVTRDTTAKGRSLLKAQCPRCGTKMTKFTK